ncbi:MAG: hypothetical protein CM1200mP16_08040 [Nitrospina sp.]|nr:MAG: hypothetical protein CM1200mP16_08040 [Nitrospina sp.]
MQLSKFSMESGCAGVMVGPISGLNTEKKLYDYFAQVFDALGKDIPVCFKIIPNQPGTFFPWNALIDL